MKLSTTPTNIIMVKVYTHSDWDLCDFALISLGDKKYKEILKKRCDAANTFIDDINFSYLAFWSNSIGYFVSNDDKSLGTVTPELPEDLSWSYVKVTEKEIEKMVRPDSSLDSYMMKVSTGNSIQFTCYGKHTGEKFWTDDIDLITFFKLNK